MKTTVTGLVILLITTMASASVLRIPADYPDIQSGIEHAATGDTVLLVDMEFSGDGNCNIDFLGKSITVQSENGPDNCIINCGEHSRGFIFQTAETENAVLSGVTITGGFAAEDDLCRGGGGIVCIRNASPTIQHCNITHCKAQSGAGVYISHGSPVISNCTFDGNEAAWDGGGIYLSHGEPEITGCTFSNNKAITFSGGGIYIALASPGITDTSFFGNSAINGAGIFATGYCEPTITQCTLHDNEAEAGGGIYSCTDLGEINSSELFNNTAINGGGIYLGYDAGVLVSSNNIHDNSSEWGGGIFVFFIARSQIRNCTISGNISDFGAGIFCNNGSSPEIILNTIQNNVANKTGGGIGFKDIIYMWGPEFPVIGNQPQSGNLFDGNRAGAGADLYCEYADIPIAVGYNTFTGCLDSDYAVAGREYFQFTGNTSQLAPIMQDIYVDPAGNDQNDGLTPSTAFQTVQHALKSVMGTEQNPVTVYLAEGVYSPSATGELFPLPIISHINIQGAGQDLTILDAEQTSRVAASALSEDITITDLTFRNGLANHGGGLYLKCAELDISYCKLEDNTAKGGFMDEKLGEAMRVPPGSGGAIFSINSPYHLSNCSIVNNNACHFGGGVYVSHSYSYPCYGQPVIGGSPQDTCYFAGNVSGWGGADVAYNDYISSGTLSYNEFQGNFRSPFFVYMSDNIDISGCTSQSTPITQNVYVKPDGNDSNDGLSWDSSFKTIRHALSMLDPTPPSALTIFLANGTYSPSTNGEQFPLPILTSLNIIGDNPDTVVLDAESTGSVLLIKARRLPIHLQGLTIQGGYDESGGGINNITSDLQIENCRIVNNVGASKLHYRGLGGGIASGVFDAPSSEMTITQCDISNNTAKNGGAMYITGCDLNMNSTVISGNHADIYGGGLYLPIASISRCQVYNNDSQIGGGIFSSRITMDNTIIQNNHAVVGAGLFSDDFASVTNCLFSGNNAQAEAGAVAFSGFLNLKNCLICDNSANTGSAVFDIQQKFTKFEIYNCTFVDNISQEGSSIISETVYTNTMRRCIMYNNYPGNIDTIPVTDVYNSDIEGGYPGYQNFDLDPLFVTGPLGHYYLSQIDAGQSADSPCKDAGDLDASAVTYDTVDGIITMSDYTTRIDKVTDSGIVDIGYHYPPTGDIPTPTPTYPPTDTPTAVPTDTPITEPTSTPLPDLGVKLTISQSIFYPGDPFLLEATLSNPGPDTYQELPFVILLDAYGEFFFYPGWTSDFQYEPVNLGLEKYTTTILKFDWPEVDGKSDDIFFYGAFLNPGMTDILGSWDWKSFQWGQR